MNAFWRRLLRRFASFWTKGCWEFGRPWNAGDNVEKALVVCECVVCEVDVVSAFAVAWTCCWVCTNEFVEESKGKNWEG